jgi:protein-L-isoaspartate(D-aspartate) O-methyltransferase
MRRKAFTALPVVVILVVFILAVPAKAEREGDRRAMVETIEREFRRTAPYIGEQELDESVREALLRVPRHEFVPDRRRDRAYENRPLPIGYGQTISQPYVVALMTDMLRPGPDQKVLEVGTGSGYQAAVLAELVDRVYSIEIIPELAEQARKRLDRLGYENVTVIHGDGYYGLPEQAPFDAVIVTAAAAHIPPPLLEQLAPGGRMLIPVGKPFRTQQLMFVRKDESGEVSTRAVLPVAFVPLTGEH